MEFYEVAVDMPRRLLTLTFRGFWTDAVFDDFADEFESALRLLQRQGGCDYALVDGSDFDAQPLSISERFRGLIGRMAPVVARRTATIVPARLMGQETGEEPANARVFTDHREAKEWLLAELA